MRQFVFRLGPIDEPEGDGYEYYVYPGRDGAFRYAAAQDDIGLDTILDDYPAEELCCEPLLAGPGKNFGIPSAPYDDLRAHGLAFMGYMRVPGEPFASVLREGLVHDFVRAFRELWRDTSLLARIQRRPLRVEITGSVTMAAQVRFHAGAEPGPFATIVMDPDVEPRVLWGSASVIRQWRHIGVDVVAGPAFLLDALGRSHGLDVAPVAHSFRAESHQPVTDLQLGIVTAMLSAAAALGVEDGAASSKLTSAGLEVSAKLAWAD